MTLYLSTTASPADVLKVALAVASAAPADTLPFKVAPLNETPFNLKKPLIFETSKDEKKLIFEPNAIARHLAKTGEIADPLERAKVNQWLEIEEQVTLIDSDLLPYDVLLTKLSAAIGPQGTLISGKKNTFADLVLWAHFHSHFTLFDKNALKKVQAEFPNVAKWYENHASLTAFQQAGQIFEKQLLQHIKVTMKAPKVEALPPLLKIRDGVGIQIVREAEVLPKPGEKNFLITSALPYVNNVPHLGNIIGCVLSADVFARYCRLRGYNAVYICGTDEYGTATETKALEEGLTCQEICDKYHVLHKEIYEWFDISFDKFGRTTTPHQTEIAQDIFLKLKNNNLLSKASMVQLWCEKCQRYLADRYVEGTCPSCGYEDARGDQCDKCGKLLNAEELKNPKCKLCSTRPVPRDSDHMFLNLNDLQKDCEEWVEKSYKEGKWSENGYGITQNWFKEGLKPRCITRDLKWGTPVPLEEMKDKVFYVWFDAPIGYISITANYTKDWEKWWKNPKDVKLYQFMGKDNVPFHTVIFPCSLMGAKDNYTLLHHVSTTDFLNYEGGKFSKSRGIGVFGNNVMETGIPASVWRFYLLSNRPESNDSLFTWNDFMLKTNTELLANLGNFVNRSLKFLKGKFRGEIQVPHLTDVEHKLIAEVNNLLEKYVAALEAVEIREGLKVTMEISRIGNQYLTDNKLDNALFEGDRARCGTLLTVTVNMIYYLASLLYPYMPASSQSILEQLHAPLRRIDTTFTLDILPGHVIGTPTHLFSRLDEKEIDALRERYKGKQDAVESVTSAAAASKKKVKKGPAAAAPADAGAAATSTQKKK